MSETAAKVRLVRCPKCENLLPEVTDYSVYQCGGCGAILRAGNRSTESGTFSDKSDVESDGGALNRSHKQSGNTDFVKRRANDSSMGSENGIRSNRSSGRRSGGEDKTMEMNKSIEEMSNLKIAEKIDNSKPQIANNSSRSRRSVWTSNWRNGSFQNTRSIGVEEGPSSYYYESHHEYAELVQGRNDGVDIEDDRVELLRKLDELKDQIVRSRPLGDKSKEKAPMHHVPSVSNYIEPTPFRSHHPPLPSSNQVQGFNDPFSSQILGRGPIQAPIMPFEQNPYHPYYPGRYVSNDLVDNRQFHPPSCSCLICYGKLQQVPPPPAPPIAPPVLPNDPILYHRDYNPRFSNLPQMNVRNSEAQTRWSNDLRRPPRGILTTGGRRCRPIASGSPFVACCNCFELLQVPKMSMKKNLQKMRCAACSEVISLSVVDKKLVLSIYRNPEMAEDTNNSNTHQHAKWGSTEFSSDDYDNSGNYDFQSMDRLNIGGPNSTSYKSAAMRSIPSMSSYTSEDERTLGTREEANSADGAVKFNKPPSPPSGSPLQEHFDYSTKYNRAGKGNRSGRSDMEKVTMVDKVASCQNSMKDAAVATEMEISSNEYGINTATSQESGDTSREVNQLRNNRGGDSFFAGIKKSFRDFSRSGQSVDEEKVNVTVNGHPIPERMVRKAEKLAGPIQPGEFWYDSKAGFWGMMGGPCRGIIPPFIEEFNYPMPENCAGGNTGVFVNGRELHQKDLDLLASRGLPTDTDRYYIIEISGRVLDEDSGKELESLGKLAPTVESKKHGFGMKPPRVAAN